VDRVVILARDPHWAFVYWELSSATVARLHTQHGAAMPEHPHWALCVHTLRRPGCSGPDDASGGPHFVDVDIHAGQWYLKTAPDTHLAVDLGFVSPQGEYVCVLRGNQVATPRPAASDVSDERWWILRPELEQLLRAGAPGWSIPATGSASPETAPRFLRSEQPRAAPLFSSYLAHLERKKK
jgi:hypothetical protein